MKQSELWTLFTEWVKILGALCAFSFGLFEFVRAQKWKRGEFVAAQIKEFEADKKVQAAMTMLDWSNRPISLPAEGSDTFHSVMIDEQILSSALLPHDQANGYSTTEAAIRDCFDRFFDGLARFWHFVESGLLQPSELRPYLNYWMNLIEGKATTQHPRHFYVLLHNYIKIYGFTGVEHLMKRMSYDLAPPAGAVADAIRVALAERLRCNEPKDLTPEPAGDDSLSSSR